MRSSLVWLLATGGTVVLLHIGALGVPAGQGDVPRGRLSPPGEEHADARLDGAPPALSAVPHQHALADPTLASTAAKREQLKYLVRCALPAEVALYADIAGERFTFPGSIGLAPRWLTEAMTPSEERWVSACLLAHVNYFGKHVRISTRATGVSVPELEASIDEQQTYTIFEGGFFGNLFLPEPVAYTCRGERSPAQARDPILQDRVCTQEAGTTTAAGTPVTVCHFLLTGRCEDPSSFTVNGTLYSEVVFVYLKPSVR